MLLSVILCHYLTVNVCRYMSAFATILWSSSCCLSSYATILQSMYATICLPLPQSYGHLVAVCHPMPLSYSQCMPLSACLCHNPMVIYVAICQPMPLSHSRCMPLSVCIGTILWSSMLLSVILCHYTTVNVCCSLSPYTSIPQSMYTTICLPWLQSYMHLHYLVCCYSLCWLVNRCSHFIDSISNGRIQYRTVEFNITIWPLQVTRLVLTSKVILKLYEMYLLFFLSMKEQVINSFRPVGKCNPAWYPTEVIQIWITEGGYQAGLHQQGVTNNVAICHPMSLSHSQCLSLYVWWHCWKYVTGHIEEFFSKFQVLPCLGIQNIVSSLWVSDSSHFCKLYLKAHYSI